MQLSQKLTSSSFPPKPIAIRLLLSSPPPPSLPSLLKRHALILTSGNSTDPFIAAKLISLYSSFRRPDLSSLLFSSSSIPPLSRDAFLWNSLIQSHFSNSLFSSSLSLSSQMLASGLPFDSFTLPILASASAELAHIPFGRSLHAQSVKLGIYNDISSLVYMYSKCGAVADALKVFGEMPGRNVVAWTAVVIGCVSNGEWEMGMNFLREMCRDGKVPSWRALEGGIHACGSLGAVDQGRCLHGVSVKVGVEGWCSVRSTILSMYSKCESLEEARRAFGELTERDVVSWTSIVGVYARKGLVGECLELFWEMMGSGIEPDGVLLSCLLVGFANGNNVYGAKAFHGIIVRRNLEVHKLVVNSLLTMYCKFELLDDAAKVFHKMSSQDSEAWNLMLSEYAKKGLDAKCLDLFREMHSVGLGRDCGISSLIPVISSCSQLGALPLGQSVHCYTIKNAVHGDPSVYNSLIAMYGKCERLDLTRRIFDKMPRDVITWNAMISAYAHIGHSNDALSLFDQMLLENVKPNSTTLLSALSACSHMAARHKGKWIHEYIKESGLECDISLYTALVDMYAKCGKLETAREVFDSMLERDIVTYNVMISGYGFHGDAKEALEIFGEMERRGVKPNEVTFLALLSACSHVGLVEEGKSLFDRMRNYSIQPALKHYACMVDLLARSGNLYEAEALIHSMPIEPDGAIWGALLGACHIYNNAEMGERIANKAVEFDPENDGYYVLMSNMFGRYGRWKEVESLRGVMKSRGVRKRAGWSSVELEGRIQVFVVGEKSHIQSEEINLVLEALGRQMEEWSCYTQMKHKELRWPG
nr:pentatricopeptide repeat protein AaPPR576 [Agave angustifolia]UPT49188.1 pentatricopeptide repeat protein AaPPR1162 [Agave angustifolia]UPT49495.1 pentatricopeptide repeat protein AaPPR658 [Agave angustifolia]UPT49540.1 pentatricopeptide repeat protein AaPPR796 [Agave angustifolia]